MELLTKVLDDVNIEKAYKQVVRNGGSKGVDGITTEELQAYMQIHWVGIKQKILDGHYIPKQIKGVEIPKPKGGKRLLGIPSVIDRLIQQAIHQVLNPMYDIEFSEHSYGFRKGRNAHQAIFQAQSYINDGYQYIIDLDLENFFDLVNQDYLMSLLHRKIKDRLLLKLIRRYLQSDIMIGGLTQQRERGIPQGSPLSPLLSNIILNELDKESEKRELRFVRYADDCSIFVKSRMAAFRVKRSITKFIEIKLHLRVNEEKTKICRPFQYSVLGYGFVPVYEKGVKGKYQLRVSPESIKRMKFKVKEITRKTDPVSFDKRIKKLNAFARGWINYFKYANFSAKLKELDAWIRNRLRYCIWKHWKRPNKRMRSFIQLGIPKDKAYAWSRSRLGGWAIAQSPIMNTTVTVERLRVRGYVSFIDLYLKSHRTLSEDTQYKLSFR